MPITRHGYSNHRAQRRAQYDSPEHRRQRNFYAPFVARGLVDCARCGFPIQPGAPWDMDHTDDRAGYIGPSHAACNRAAGAHRGGGGPSKNLSRGDSPPHLARK